MPVRLFAVFALLCLLLTPRGALAEDGKTVALYVEGEDAEAVRDELLETLPKSLRVVAPEAFAKSLSAAGLKPPMGNAITVAKQREKLLAKIRKALDSAHTDAAVVGRVRKGKGGGREVWVMYIDPIPGDLAVDEAVPLNGNRDDEVAALQATLGPTLEQLAPSAPDEAKTTKSKGGEAKGDAASAGEGGTSEGEPDKATEPAPPAGPRTKHDPATAMAVVGGAFELGGRKFDYSDGLSDQLRPYSLFGAPMFELEGEAYPGADSKLPVLKDLGATLSYARAFAAHASTKDGTTVASTYQRFSIGLRLRFRTGAGPAPIIGVRGAFQTIGFSFDDAPQKLAPGLPGVSYKVLRFGADARFPFGKVALLAAFDYLAPLSTGDVYARFREASVGGIATELGVALGLSPGVEARLAADYTRFFSSFTPEPGDKYVAGGALDEFFGVRLGAVYVY